MGVKMVDPVVLQTTVISATVVLGILAIDVRMVSIMFQTYLCVYNIASQAQHSFFSSTNTCLHLASKS